MVRNAPRPRRQSSGAEGESTPESCSPTNLGSIDETAEQPNVAMGSADLLQPGGGDLSLRPAPTHEASTVPVIAKDRKPRASREEFNPKLSRPPVSSAPSIE